MAANIMSHRKSVVVAASMRGMAPAAVGAHLWNRDSGK